MIANRITDFIELPVMQSNEPGDVKMVFVRFHHITWFEPCNDDHDFPRTRVHLSGGESIVVDLDFDKFRQATICVDYDTIDY